MASLPKGILTTPGEYWKHLRPFLKRKFWKQERREVKRDIDRRQRDQHVKE